MNYLIEGLQGSGKSTLVQKLSERNSGYQVYREGDYSPIELAWCAWVDEDMYRRVYDQYADLRPQIEAKTFPEGDHRVICYTQIRTEDRAFYRDLEQYEIYNNRIPYEDFRSIKLSRYKRWRQDHSISECALFQNTVEELILFRQASDEETIGFFREVREALEGKAYHILYLKTEDIKANLDTIRKERSDEQGNELWFPMLCGFFNDCPYARAHNLKDEEGILAHFAHRQELELRICREVFPDHVTILQSKGYRKDELPKGSVEG